MNCPNCNTKLYKKTAHIHACSACERVYAVEWPWVAGRYFTMTDHLDLGSLKLKPGDMIKYVGCRILDDEFARIFDFNGSLMPTWYQWLLDKMEPNDPPKYSVLYG